MPANGFVCRQIRQQMKRDNQNYKYKIKTTLVLSRDVLTVLSLHFFCLLLRELKLKRPIYQATASYGHFGRAEFTWEMPKKLVY